MRYLYECMRGGHEVEITARRPYPFVECPAHSGLNTPVQCERAFAKELASQYVLCDDPIRKAYNSSAIEHNLAAQGRPLDPIAPKDKFDLKHIEKATGRVYCGDNIGHMSPKAQKAILNGDRRPGEPRPII